MIEKFFKVVVTQSENSGNVSCVMFCFSACCLSFSVMEWKKFSMGLMSGLRGGIFSCFAFKAFRAWRTLSGFCMGSLSCTKMCQPFLPTLRNISENFSLTNAAKVGPSKCSYG